MPTKVKITVTPEHPAFLGEYLGIGQRKVDLVHVHALAETFALWKDKPLILWKTADGTYAIGGQHRLTAIREFIFPTLKAKKLEMDALIYSPSEAPHGVSERDFLLRLITADNAGKANSPYDIAQLDHSKPWYSLTKAHGIEFGQGGSAKTLHAETIIRAVVLARGYLETGRFSQRPWLQAFESDSNVPAIEKALLYSRWWDEHVAMAVHPLTAKVNMLKPACLSLAVAIALDPNNGFPQNPADLSTSRPKQRTWLESPAKLIACGLYDRTKGNNCGSIWTGLLEPINAGKNRAIGRLYVAGQERWV